MNVDGAVGHGESRAEFISQLLAEMWQIPRCEAWGSNITFILELKWGLNEMRAIHFLAQRNKIQLNHFLFILVTQLSLPHGLTHQVYSH